MSLKLKIDPTSTKLSNSLYKIKIIMGKGQNYENHNVENQKELQKLRRRSGRRKCPSIFHKSDQNVKNKKHQLPMAYNLWLPRPVGV